MDSCLRRNDGGGWLGNPFPLDGGRLGWGVISSAFPIRQGKVIMGQKRLAQPIELMLGIGRIMNMGQKTKYGKADVDMDAETLSFRRRKPSETTLLDKIWPVHPTKVWPDGLVLRREDIYDDRA